MPTQSIDTTGSDAWREDVHAVAAQLRGALTRFAVEAPDAQRRLEQVLKFGDDAAHRTIDLIELSLPLAEQTASSATAILAQWRAERDAQPVSAHTVESFLDQTIHNMNTVTVSLSEVLLAHGAQDHANRVMRGVDTLVQQLEAAITDLQRLTGDAAGGIRNDQANDPESRREPPREPLRGSVPVRAGRGS